MTTTNFDASKVIESKKGRLSALNPMVINIVMLIKV